MNIIFGKKICPECGFPDVYIGVRKIECGYEPNCKNYTKKQAKVVKELEEEARLRDAEELDKISNKDEETKKQKENQSNFDFDDDTLPFGFPISYSPD